MNDCLVIKLMNNGVTSRNNGTLSLLFQTYLLKHNLQIKAYLFFHTLINRAIQKLHQTIPVALFVEIYKTILEFGTDLLDYYDIMNATVCFIKWGAKSLFFLNQ